MRAPPWWRAALSASDAPGRRYWTLLVCFIMSFMSASPLPAVPCIDQFGFRAAALWSRSVPLRAEYRLMCMRYKTRSLFRAVAADLLVIVLRRPRCCEDNGRSRVLLRRRALAHEVLRPLERCGHVRAILGADVGSCRDEVLHRGKRA